MEITEETIWITLHGEKVKLDDITDIHLVNLLNYSEKYNQGNLNKVLKRIVKKRKLSKSFKSRKRIPYIRNGRWAYWNTEINSMVYCGIYEQDLDEAKIIELVAARLKGTRPRVIHHMCTKCGIPYNAINGKVILNRKKFTICTYCRVDGT